MSDLPTFSVVVPTFKRPERLRACVAAIAALDYPRDRLELVVVDDGSPVPLDDAVAAARGDLDVRLIRQDNAGPATARNRGAAEARHEYLAFTDDDCLPRPDWLRAFAAAFTTNPDAMLGGRFANGLPRNNASVASHTVTDLIYEIAETNGQGTGPNGAWLFVTACLAVPRRLFLEVGGFDESFPLAAAEDFDFCHHYQHHGHPAAYVPAAVVDHYHAMNLRQFWRQHYGYGRGMLQFRRRAKARLGCEAERKIGPFQIRLAARLLRNLRGPRSVVNGLYVGVSQVAIIAGALREARAIDKPESRREKKKRRKKSAAPKDAARAKT